MYGPALGALAALVVGVPVTVALACLGKAFEIAAVLRLPSRTRGAIVGIMSWLGYATMMVFLLGLVALPHSHSRACPPAHFPHHHSVALARSLPWPDSRLPVVPVRRLHLPD
jgi:hypothetical protein